MAQGNSQLQEANRLDGINIGLMLIAWFAAMAAPFHLFLFAYAVLGPLHYATEISWLNDRGYFLPPGWPRRSWLALVGMTVITLVAGYVFTEVLHRPIPPQYEVGLVYLALIAAGLTRYLQSPSSILALLVLSLGVIAIASGQAPFFVVAYLLVTIIHVLAFTAAFILYGALKSGSRTGVVSLVVFSACVIGSLTVAAPAVAPSPAIRRIYEPFETLNSLLASLLMNTGSNQVDSTGGFPIMRLIAFAYTYHYLNWFSKTSVIGWHHVSRRRALGIVGIWIGSVVLYALDYSTGFAVLYGISLLHVLLEFPLNLQTGAGIAGLIRSRGLRVGRAAGTSA